MENKELRKEIVKELHQRFNERQLEIEKLLKLSGEEWIKATREFHCLIHKQAELAEIIKFIYEVEE